MKLTWQAIMQEVIIIVCGVDKGVLVSLPRFLVNVLLSLLFAGNWDPPGLGFKHRRRKPFIGFLALKKKIRPQQVDFFRSSSSSLDFFFV